MTTPQAEQETPSSSLRALLLFGSKERQFYSKQLAPDNRYRTNYPNAAGTLSSKTAWQPEPSGQEEPTLILGAYREALPDISGRAYGEPPYTIDRRSLRGGLTRLARRESTGSPHLHVSVSSVRHWHQQRLSRLFNHWALILPLRDHTTG